MAREINKTKIAIVTGSSSGIGFETTLLLARNGFFTYATMRNPDKSDRIIGLKQKERLPLEVLKFDVTDDKSVTSSFKTSKGNLSFCFNSLILSDLSVLRIVA